MRDETCWESAGREEIVRFFHLVVLRCCVEVGLGYDRYGNLWWCETDRTGKPSVFLPCHTPGSMYGLVGAIIPSHVQKVECARAQCARGQTVGLC